MGVELLRSFLWRHGRIALDTSIFIYQIEAYPKYLALTREIFSWLQQPGATAVTSTITMTEVLVQPYRDSDDERVRKFYGLLATYPNLSWIATDLEIAANAARLRAIHRLHTPDALQASTAEYSRATGFISNDPIFGRIKSFETLTLDNIVSSTTLPSGK